MKNQQQSTFLIIGGIVILCIFTYISVYNLIPDNSSESYFSKNDKNGSAVIENIEYVNGKISVTINNDESMVCVKQTKSNPKLDSICWKEANNQVVEVSVYYGKTYYIWLKDGDDIISSPVKFVAS